MNKFINIKLILPFFLLFTLLSFGQQDKRDQIKALKSSHIAAALDLTTAEGSKFWPLYLAFEEKQYEIRHFKIRPLTNKIEEKGIDAISPKEALLYVIQLEAAEEELFKLRKKFILDLKPAIGPRKILKFKKAEDDFNRILLSKYKGKKD